MMQQKIMTTSSKILHGIYTLLREEWQTTRELRVEAASTLRLLVCLATLILQILGNVLEISAIQYI